MKKWKLVSIFIAKSLASDNGRVDIFPANQIDLNWLFQQFPKIKRSNLSAGQYLSIDTNSHLTGDVVDAIWNYLGENGWEYCGDGYFKLTIDKEEKE